MVVFFHKPEKYYSGITVLVIVLKTGLDRSNREPVGFSVRFAYWISYAVKPVTRRFCANRPSQRALPFIFKKISKIGMSEA